MLSDFVSLAGEGLTNDVLAMFTGWERVVHLAIRDTSLTPDALELIGRCPLTRLTTGNNRNISRNAMEQVAANNDSLLWVDSDAYQ